MGKPHVIKHGKKKKRLLYKSYIAQISTAVLLPLSLFINLRIIVFSCTMTTNSKNNKYQVQTEVVYHVSDELEPTLVFLLHRSDSNQGTDYIATSLSLISVFQMLKFKIYKSISRKLIFCLQN